MLRVYFIRHPDTKWNKQRRYLGKTDIVLSSEGRRQAELIANFFKNKNISAVYSSSLRRAYQTARLIAEYHPLLKIKIDDNFDEIDFGQWEGMTFGHIQKKYPELAQRYLSNPLNTKIPGGESLLKFRCRVKKALEKVLTRESGEIVIVSHAGVNRIIICALLSLPFSYFWQIKQDVGAINAAEIHKNINIISSVNHIL